MEAARAETFALARACSLMSARSPLSPRWDCTCIAQEHIFGSPREKQDISIVVISWLTCRYLARLRAAISSASSICFLYDLILACNWSTKDSILCWFFPSSSSLWWSACLLETFWKGTEKWGSATLFHTCKSIP